MSSRDQEDHRDSQDELCRASVGMSKGPAPDEGAVYEPEIRQPSKHLVEVWARKEQPGVIAWGFWGGVLAAAVAVYIVLEGSTAMLSLGDVLLVSTILMVGLIIFRLGRRSSLEEELLFEVDGRFETLSWPVGDGQLKALAFEDVETIVFSLVETPVPGSKAGTKLSAAQVSLRDHEGKSHPVIFASPSKGEAHRVARGLGQALGLNVDYEGTGVKEWV